MMQAGDPRIIDSPLSGLVQQDGVAIEVSIFRLEDSADWSLEAINEAKTSIIWEDLFYTDQAAFQSFWAVVEAEGIRTFLDSSNVVPFRRPSD